MPDINGNALPGEPGYTAPPAGNTPSSTGIINTVSDNPANTVAGYTPSTATATPATSTGYQANPFTVTPQQTVSGPI